VSLALSVVDTSSGMFLIGCQKMLDSASALASCRSCGTTFAIAARGTVMPAAMPTRIAAMASSTQPGSACARRKKLS